MQSVGAKVCNSRKSTHSIMSNSGFGGVTHYVNGICLLIPVEAIKADGNIKKCVLELMKELTRESIVALEKYNVKVVTA